MPKATPEHAAPTTPKPAISIVDRRLKAGSIFASASTPIPASEPGCWVFREVNTGISDDHLEIMLHKKFWEFAAAEDLACAPGAYSYRVQDGRLVKGTRGEIVLMKQPAADAAAVRMEKERENRRLTFGSAKASILSAAEREPGGDRGAEYLERQLRGLTVTDSKELVPLDDAA